MRRLLCSMILPAMILAASVNFANAVDPAKRTRPATAATSPYVLPSSVAPATSTPTKPTTPTTIFTPTQPATSAPLQPATLPAAQPSTILTRDRAAGPVSQIAPSLLPGTEPTSPGRPPRWRLGVYSQDTETGVKVLRTVTGSPAEIAGLEANDLIVAVNGFQVGLVNGQQYDCGYEFENRADEDGNIILLVQDHRNGVLVNLPVKLESRMKNVTGSIAYRNRIYLPQNAVAEVELREVRPQSPVITVGRQTIDEIRQIPIPFKIEYDPLDIDTRRNYVIHATITSGDRTLYTTTEEYPVITNGKSETVAVSVERAAQDPQTAALDRQREIEEQIRTWFRDFMGREPRSDELPVWTAQVTERNKSLFDVQADFLTNNEVWNVCEQDRERYIRMLSERIIGKQPTQEELDYWLWKYAQSGGVRRDVAEQFLTAAGVPR